MFWKQDSRKFDITQPEPAEPDELKLSDYLKNIDIVSFKLFSLLFLLKIKLYFQLKRMNS